MGMPVLAGSGTTVSLRGRWLGLFMPAAFKPTRLGHLSPLGAGQALAVFFFRDAIRVISAIAAMAVPRALLRSRGIGLFHRDIDSRVRMKILSEAGITGSIDGIDRESSGHEVSCAVSTASIVGRTGRAVYASSSFSVIGLPALL